MAMLEDFRFFDVVRSHSTQRNSSAVRRGRPEPPPSSCVLKLRKIAVSRAVIKTNEARTIVIHPHLVELGFPAFAGAAPAGHLFLKAAPDGDVLGPLQGVKNRLAEFSRSIVTDPNVAPMHGWRHRFKTVGMEAGIQTRVLDAIQGHAPRTAAEGYGEVTINTMAAAIERIPRVTV